MGKLVQFSRRARSTKARSADRQTAQIVLFTGVRYQREDDSNPLPDKPIGAAGAKRRRG